MARRFAKALLVLLLAWQIGVLLLAGGVAVGLFDDEVPPLSPADRAFVSSLQKPDEDAIAASLHQIRDLHEIHTQAIQRWRTAAKIALRGAPAKRIREKLGTVPHSWPTIYHRAGGFSHENLPARALYAVKFAYFAESLIPMLRSVRDLRLYQSESWQRISAHAELLTLITAQRWEDARILVDEHFAERTLDADKLKESLLQRALDPADFDARFEMIGRLRRIASGKWFPIAYLELHWSLYSEAVNDEQRAAVLQVLATYYEVADYPGGSDARRLCHIASARLAARAENQQLQAEEILHVADWDVQRANALLAAKLYGCVVDDFPSGAQLGRSLFNQGYSLRQAGYPRACRKALTVVFGSTVNDMDPTSNIMEAYRNYRYQSAREIARAYEDQWSFPQAYYWQCLAAWKYPYRSWCGTCEASQRAEMKRGLLWSSCKAGPLFITAHLLIAPVWNWYVWLGLSVVGCFLWRRRRQSKARTASSSSGHID